MIDDRMSNVLRKLSVETFVLNVARELRGAPDVPGYDVRLLDEHTLEVDVESARGINDLFDALTGQGVQVISLRNKSNRLEELFMRLVENKQARRANGG